MPNAVHLHLWSQQILHGEIFVLWEDPETQLRSELSLARGFFGMQRCWLSRVWMDAGFQCLGTKLAMLGFTIIWELCDCVSVRVHLRWQTMRKSSAYRKKKRPDKKCRFLVSFIWHNMDRENSRSTALDLVGCEGASEFHLNFGQLKHQNWCQNGFFLN